MIELESPKQFLPIALLFIGLAFFGTTRVAGESPACLSVYGEGGAPAVLQSPKCPRWTLSNIKSGYQSHSSTCQAAILQGKRRSLEDRTLCTVDLRIPFPGPKGIKEVNVMLMAVFDGHNGAEASQMASELMLEYFVLHLYFMLDMTYSFLSRNVIRRLPDQGEAAHEFEKIGWGKDFDDQFLDLGRFKVTLPSILEGSFPFELLREALLSAIHDVDASFSKDASRHNLSSGTTATVVLLADQLLVANVGDSKALLCSEVYQSPSEAKATVYRIIRKQRSAGASSSLEEYRQLKSKASNGWMFLVAKELTNDHHPDREDEKSRVESAGGHISEWGGIARINGHLTVSRSIGDVHFKRYGVISVPEVTDWQPLTANDSYLIVASDGVFEKLSSQDICDILWEPLSGFALPPELNSSCSYSPADCIVNTAFQRGSMDNLAAVMLPVRGSGSYDILLKDKIRSTLNKLDNLALGDQKQHDDKSSDDNTSLRLGLQPHHGVAKFDRLLVEGQNTTYKSFYLAENLDVYDDYTFWIHKDDPVSDLSPALASGNQYVWGEHLDQYDDQHVCMNFNRYIDEDKDQCLNSHGFARFLGFLESIPFHSMGQTEHVTSDTRYILKKKFDRGAFGEVWLAFNWHLGACDENTHTNFFHDCNITDSDDNMFILKRIMVERGRAAYLSGLREKYFGEVFLNASNILRSSSSSGLLEFTWRVPQPNGSKYSNKSVDHDTGEPLSFENVRFEGKTYRETPHEEGLNHIARYVESFESRSNEIWLVFRHEGISLSKFVYTAEEVTIDSDDEEKSEPAKRIQILRPSKWWHWLKTTEAGQEELRDIIWQLLMALKSCHDRNITHRDIKPENMVMCLNDPSSGSCLRQIPSTDFNYTSKMRIIDFGSAVNDYTVKHLYGSMGPSSDEQTSGYAPPEAFLNVSWYHGPSTVTAKYDMWSVGVVMLELILGTPNVFQISSITQALLDQHLKGWNDNLRELAYRLRALMEMCILITGTSSKLRQNWGASSQGSGSPVPWKCSEEYFAHQIKSRDPLKIGFPNIWALRLVRDLLLWDPEDRIGVDEALGHPYFTTVSKKAG